VQYASVGLPIASAILYFIFQQPVLLVLIGALGQGVMLPFLGGVAVYFHHRRLAPVLPTSRWFTLGLWLATIAMALVGSYQIAQIDFRGYIAQLTGRHAADVQPDARTGSRVLGSWDGSGDRTLGFVSDSGVFRVAWQTRDGRGPFRLMLHSAVSGRPLKLIADQRGEAAGVFDFHDEPRLYDLMVDSSGVGWSIKVEELSR
jgi:hypothetical protein